MIARDSALTERANVFHYARKVKTKDELNGEEIGLQEYSSWSDTKQTGQNPTAMKRKIADVSPVVPQKKKKVSGPPQVKNAVQTLNEYKAGFENWRSQKISLREGFKKKKSAEFSAL